MPYISERQFIDLLSGVRGAKKQYGYFNGRLPFAHREKFLEYAQIQKGHCVLDVGSSEGLLSLLLSCTYDDVEVTNLEVSPKAIRLGKRIFEVAEKKRPGIANRVKFVLGEIESPPPEKYDRILLSGSLSMIRIGQILKSYGFERDFKDGKRDPSWPKWCEVSDRWFGFPPAAEYDEDRYLKSDSPDYSIGTFKLLTPLVKRGGKIVILENVTDFADTFAIHYFKREKPRDPKQFPFKQLENYKKYLKTLEADDTGFNSMVCLLQDYPKYFRRARKEFIDDLTSEVKGIKVEDFSILENGYDCFMRIRC